MIHLLLSLAVVGCSLVARAEVGRVENLCETTTVPVSDGKSIICNAIGSEGRHIARVEFVMRTCAGKYELYGKDVYQGNARQNVLLAACDTIRIDK